MWMKNSCDFLWRSCTTKKIFKDIKVFKKSREAPQKFFHAVFHQSMEIGKHTNKILPFRFYENKKLFKKVYKKTIFSTYKKICENVCSHLFFVKQKIMKKLVDVLYSCLKNNY